MSRALREMRRWQEGAPFSLNSEQAKLKLGY